MIYLDTHAVVWLYLNQPERFTPEGIRLIENNELLISPMVEFELEYLFEIDRLNEKSREIISYLQQQIDLKVCDLSFERVVNQAKNYKWTRDPFDRIITAQAELLNRPLLTKDKNITKHYLHALW